MDMPSAGLVCTFSQEQELISVHNKAKCLTVCNKVFSGFQPVMYIIAITTYYFQNNVIFEVTYPGYTPTSQPRQGFRQGIQNGNQFS